MCNLKNRDLDRKVKPRILNSLGDIALAIGGQFERFLPWVMKFLQQASTVDFKDERVRSHYIKFTELARQPK